MPEVEDHVVGVDRGQHVAEGAVVGVVVVCVPGVFRYTVIVMVKSLDNIMNNVCNAQYNAMLAVMQEANTMTGLL